VSAAAVERPGRAVVARAQRAHEQVAGGVVGAARVADVAGGRVVREREEAVGEGEQAEQAGREQPGGVEAEPGEVEGQLLAEVGADEVDGLVEVEALGIRPVVPEKLAGGFLGGAAVL